ncbi:hypothetical protein J2Z32_003561 [Paenibacillus turicensis]|uniref:DUF4097 domain-containing protein n=1 Tax=Paenibacillus turicensis TaxID=160487 RepID=A0ABS4FWD0_9BACL|nr:DUF4097 family beta strand repeat-containing protein [Paenibacillus turicensis]MBP1906896.1 hypothetical protein [Paenibacillus turicensis]
MMLSNQGQAVIRHIKIPLDSALSLNLDWLTGQVRIMPNSNNEIEIIQYADTGFKIEKAFQYELHASVITITDGRKSSKLGVNLKKTCLEIFVPAMLLSNINIKGVGTQIKLSEINTKVLQCNVVSGKLQLSGAYEKLQLQATASNVDAQLCEVRELTVKSTSSKLRVCIPEALRFTISTGKLTSRKAIRSSLPLQYEKSQLEPKEGEARFHVSIAGGHMEIVPLDSNLFR